MGDFETTKAMMIDLAMKYAADAVKRVSLKQLRDDQVRAARSQSSSAATGSQSRSKKRPAAAATAAGVTAAAVQEDPAPARVLKKLYQDFTCGP